jgi:phage terminase large subunit
MYLTCNPGGVGHQWVKRLFVTRDFRRGEDPADYSFIPATVEDNRVLLKGSPDYLAQLELLPDDLRAAHRYGDWDALAGRYFSEFSREHHVTDPFQLPAEWPRYRCFDYGLDLFACLWFAVDFDGRVWVYREFCESGLIISEAAGAMTALTPPGEQVRYTVAPPDMWSTQKDTGRTMAEVFTRCGVGLVKASNARVQGWLTVKEYLKLRPDGKPGLVIFRDCRRLIHDLEALQHDDKNPSDAAKQPHDVTHAPDALRYGLIFRNATPTPPQPEEREEDEELWLTGGEPLTHYFTF